METLTTTDPITEPDEQNDTVWDAIIEAFITLEPV